MIPQTGDVLAMYSKQRIAGSVVGFALVTIVAIDGWSVDRHYYNRFLAHRLANPLTDGKQLVLFCNVPRDDVATLRQALHVVADRCGKPNLARMYTAISEGENWT